MKKQSKLKFLSTVLIFSALSLNILQAQENEINFYEIITGDSVKMFFNEGGTFTEKSCAQYFRYVRIDNKGQFNGDFIDKDTNNNLIGKGKYIHGMKQGNFEVYYSTGILRCKGNYNTNKPIGIWEFFYNTGKPERIINCTTEGNLLVQFIDENGNILVNESNGYFEGIVAGTFLPYNSIRASGLIQNGKSVGKWTSQTYKEEYRDGIFLKGIFKPSEKLPPMNYTDFPVLNTFFLRNYIINLESFTGTKCNKLLIENDIAKKFNLDSEKFKSSINFQIDRILDENVYSEKRKLFLQGKNAFKVQFSFNEKGEAVKFKMISDWGNEFYYSIVSILKKYLKYQSTSSTYYYFNLYFIPVNQSSVYYLYSFTDK